MHVDDSKFAFFVKLCHIMLSDIIYLNAALPVICEGCLLTSRQHLTTTERGGLI